MTVWPLQKNCDAFYGNPRGAGNGASAKWEAENLVTVKCPWGLKYNGKAVAGIRIHRKAADSLTRVLNAIWERVGRSQTEVDRIGMSKYGGSYNFRAMRGGAALSMHSYGCALDFDPARNALGSKKMSMDMRVIEEFEREGWEWGGHWSRPDGMHFQAARTKAIPARLATSTTAPAAKALTSTEIMRLQAQLKNLGYYEVGIPDGKLGDKTRSALLAFKADNGLELTVGVDNAVWVALAKAKPRPAPAGRAKATTAPSVAAKTGTALKVVGGVAAVSGAADTALQPIGGLSGALDRISKAGDHIRAISAATGPIKDLINLVSENWTLVVVIGGILAFGVGRRLFSDELESFKKGEWS